METPETFNKGVLFLEEFSVFTIQKLLTTPSVYVIMSNDKQKSHDYRTCNFVTIKSLSRFSPFSVQSKDSLVLPILAVITQ